MRKLFTGLQSFSLRKLLSKQAESSTLAVLSRRTLERPEDLHKEYETIARLAAQALDVERVGIWFFSEDRRRIHNALLYTQSSNSFSSEPHLSAIDFPNYFQALETGRAIDARDARRDPRTREFRETYLLKHGISSMLDAPIRSRGTLVGIVCFEHIGPKRLWSDTEQLFAASIADIVALTAVSNENLRARQDLMHHAAFENLILGIAKSFLHASRDTIDDIVFSALKDVGEFSGMDCCYIYPFDGSKHEMTVAHGWSRAKSPVRLGEKIACAAFPDLIKRIQRLETIYLPDVSSLSSRAEIDRTNLLAKGVSSLVWVPLKKGTEARGVVGFCSISGRKSWTPESIQLLQVLADMFSNLLERNELEREREIAQERERLLESKMQQLQTLDSIGLLAAGTAHDFNNLLTSILGNTALALRQLPDGSPAIRYLAEVRATAQRAGELTSQLLDCSGKRRPVSMDIDLNVLISEVIEMARPLFPRNASVTLDLAPGRLMVAGDAVQLRQVLFNIVKNALDALTREQKFVAVRTDRVECSAEYLRTLLPGDSTSEGPFAIVEVTDTGGGIDSDALPRIFDPFFSTKSHGRGFGLAASLGIIRSHKGAICVQSDPEKGSTFRVYFPRDHESSDARTSESSESSLRIEVQPTGERNGTEGPSENVSAVAQSEAAVLKLKELVETVS